jgi:hypothetical protein
VLADRDLARGRTSIMRPSGAALATAFAAIMPAAPTRFSTITG